MDENWCVFCLAILKNLPVEKAFYVWEEKDPRYWITPEDVEDMRKMKSYMTNREIGQIYDIGEAATCRRIKGY